MGMAASQARYLELTARQTNVEYQGQQINQQRTELANESAGMFTQLMSLQVPTAPSSSDYTTVNYTFNDGVNTNTIQNGGITPITGDPQYNANVTYSYTTSPYTGVVQTRSDLTASNVGGTYWLGSTKLTAYDATTDKTALDQIVKDNPSIQLATDYAADPTKIYKYTSGSTAYYVCKTDLDNLITTPGSPIDTCYAANINKTNTQTSEAYVQKADSGRYSSIQLANTSTPFDLTATSNTDQNAYNDAMNEYTYQQQLYEQQVQSINAKTEVIQQEDMTLELQLRQLDTEQQALQTEMDSVKKVIDKNIESTFKTFSS